MQNTERAGEYVAGNHMQDRERIWYRVRESCHTHISGNVPWVCAKFRKIISINSLQNETLFVFSLL